MKAWKVTVRLKHKKCNRKYCSKFIVLNNGDEDPMDTVRRENDLSGVIYLGSESVEISLPFVYSCDIVEFNE